MDTLSSVVTATLPLLGVLIGASLQYLFSRSAEHQKHLASVRTQAYVDYLRSVAQLAHTNRTASAKRSELLADAADAKARISIYGSSTVITNLAAFERGGPNLNTDDARNKFLDLCYQMRRDSTGTNAQINSTDLYIILFGPD